MVLKVRVSPDLISGDVDEGYGKVADVFAGPRLRRKVWLRCAVSIAATGPRLLMPDREGVRLCRFEWLSCDDRAIGTNEQSRGRSVAGPRLGRFPRAEKNSTLTGVVRGGFGSCRSNSACRAVSASKGFTEQLYSTKFPSGSSV